MTHQNCHLKLNYYKFKQTTTSSVQALSRIFPLGTSPSPKTIVASNINTRTMIKKLSFVTISLLVGLILSGSCSNNKKADKFDLTKEVWIYDSPSMPDSIRNFTDNFIIFDSNNVSLNYENLGEYTIKNDTLRIFQTSYVSPRGGKDQKRVSDQFLGVIMEMDATQILIKPIRGYFPIKYKMSYGHFDKSKIIKLTNQKRKKKKHIHLNYISIASSSCYGKCPEYNLELYKDGFIKFHCSSYCKKIGFYKGKLSKDDMQKVEDFISFLNLKNDSTLFTTPIDAPEAVVHLKVNDKNHYFYGYPGEFQNKLSDLMHELFLIAEKSKLEKTNEILKFKANLRVPTRQQTIQFLPPINDDEQATNTK